MIRIVTITFLLLLGAVLARAGQTNLCWYAAGAPAGTTFEVSRNGTNNIVGRTTQTNLLVKYDRGDRFRVRAVSRWSEALTIK